MAIRRKSFDFYLEVEGRVLLYLIERVAVTQGRRMSLLGRELDFHLIGL